MPIATTEEQLALQKAIRAWAAEATPAGLTRQLEPGRAVPGAPPPSSGADLAAGAGCWDALAGLGIFSIAQPEAAGGAGGTVADLAVALEELTRALVPGPVMPTLLAGLLLASQPDLPAVKELLPALAAGQASAAVALAAGHARGTWLADGTLRVTGDTGLVLGAGSTSHLILAASVAESEPGGAPAADGGDAVWFLVAAGQPGVLAAPREPVDFSRSLTDIRLSGLTVTPDQILGGLRTTRVRDLAATLYAAEAAGVAGWCCETAAGHARARHQFGRPIGSFQAVKHLCATMLGRAERAAALAWDAARAADQAPQEHPLAAASAAAVALDAAVDNAKDCIQVLGGMGFTWEHDAHLYLRRAVALRQLLGGGAAWRRRAAALAIAGARRQLAVDAAGTSAAGIQVVARAARAAASAIAALPRESQRAALADAGYAAPQWPAPLRPVSNPGRAARHRRGAGPGRAGPP